MRKEALYCALGRCAHRLKEVIDFDALLMTTLGPESLNPSPRLVFVMVQVLELTLWPFLSNSYRLIKRRIAWLFGRWFAENSGIKSHEAVWETLAHLIRSQGESSDTVVRLTAATALGACVDVSVSYYLNATPS